MAHVETLTHKGQTIIRTAFPPTADLDALKAIMVETGAVYQKQPAGGVLSLVEFGDREFDKATIDLVEKVARVNASTVKATAFVGVTETQKPLFKAMISITGRQAKIFDADGPALDWLAETAHDEDPLAGL